MGLRVLATGAKQVGYAMLAAALLAQPVWAEGAGPKAAEAPAAAQANVAGQGGAAAEATKSGGDVSAAGPAPDIWSEQEISEAKAYCDTVLRGVEAVLEPADPIKEGECGAPAPVRLLSLGRDPEVTLSPPVTVNCDMVVKLADWLKEDLQPLALKHLGAPIVRMRTMSSYSCRNAYGRKKTRLSEHALANAIDLGSFTTSAGTEADLLKGWGLTARDVRAIVARAKAAREAAEKGPRRNPKNGKTTPADGGTEREPALLMASAGSGAKSVPLPIRKPPAGVGQWQVQLKTRAGKSTRGAPDLPSRRSQAIAMGGASHLGGPETGAADAVPEPHAPDDQIALFLRAAHGAACRRFGTVLGPEANEAHRNHFHLDMAKRKYRNYCE